MKKMRQKNENSTCAVLKSSTKVAAAAQLVVTRQIFTLFNPYPKNFTIRERHHFII